MTEGIFPRFPGSGWNGLGWNTALLLNICRENLKEKKIFSDELKEKLKKACAEFKHDIWPSYRDANKLKKGASEE